MAITPLPTPPSRQDPADFSDRADAFLGQLPLFATEANDLATDVNNKQVTASSAASTATAQAVTATNAAATSAAAANYKGEWNTLVGALNIPASVTHNASLWILKVNLANVALSEPSTSNPDWFELSKSQPTGAIVGTTDTQTLTNKTLNSCTLNAPVVNWNMQVISISTAAIKSRHYVMTASLTLTLPASPAAGDWVAVSNRSGLTSCVIGRNGQNIMGLAEDMTFDKKDWSVTLVFADTTRGWIISN